MVRLDEETKLIDIYKIHRRMDYFKKLKDEINLYMRTKNL